MRRKFIMLPCALLALTLLGAGSLIGPLHLVDTSHVPEVHLAWTTTEGTRVDLEVDHPYGSKYDRTHMAGNVEAFVCVGGTRIDKGCGHPDGLVVRVGFYKRDNGELFFEGIGSDGVLEIELRNVLANQPGRPIEQTVLQHLQYTREDIEACGLGREGQDQFNTYHPDENLLGQLTKTNARFGVLDPTPDVEEDDVTESKEVPQGAIEFIREDDDTLTMKARIPYALLRHMRDPWVRPVPGLFLEPYHFHIEFELLPDGVEPLPLKRETPVDSD